MTRRLRLGPNSLQTYWLVVPLNSTWLPNCLKAKASSYMFVLANLWHQLVVPLNSICLCLFDNIVNFLMNVPFPLKHFL